MTARTPSAIGRSETIVLDGKGLAAAITRMAKSIHADHRAAASLAIVGIQSRGVPLAARLAKALRTASRKNVDVGSLDITLYRDDLSTVGTRPVLKATNIPFSIDGRPVILVDDVLYTGRTIRAALDELVDFGRPSRIALAVLIDRGHRELPIQADYVGQTVETARADMVDVRLTETDGKDGVVSRRSATPASGPRNRAKAGFTPAPAAGGLGGKAGQ